MKEDEKSMSSRIPFIPPLRTLMGPGPSDVHPRVLQAMARPTLGHLDPAFTGMMDEVKSMLQAAFRTTNEMTMVISAPGSAGMEAAIVNLVEPGEKVAVCINGVFGTRMADIVGRCGGTALIVEQEWGRAVDPDRLEETLEANPGVKAVAFVHAETSTGALSDARALAETARRHDCLVIVDAVTSLGGAPLEVDEWGLDAVYSGSQKCLSCTPGLSPLTVSERAMDTVARSKTPVQSWFLDLGMVSAYWDGGKKRAYHHTAPINSLYGLHEALTMLHEEGLENAWRRHADNHHRLRKGLEVLGLEYLVPEGERIPHLNSVRVPDGVDEAAVRERLLADFDLEIGAGLGPLAGKIWRIGLMGHASRPKNILFCLAALKEALRAEAV
jgi:alanine-glyoxylate transaminase/serine-glyoxylate transaminase/serine-pyruvate transaminase